MPRKPLDPDARRAALKVLSQGLGTPGDVAKLCGVSRQVVEQWAIHAGLDWRAIKSGKLWGAWDNAINKRRRRHK